MSAPYNPFGDIAELGRLASEAAEKFNAYRGDGPEWGRLNTEEIYTRETFHAALDLIGLDEALLARLHKSGVL